MLGENQKEEMELNAPGSSTYSLSSLRSLYAFICLTKSGLGNFVKPTDDLYGFLSKYS